MPTEHLYLSHLFKECLHLGADLSVIERSIQELRKQDIGAVTNYFNNREIQLAPLMYWHLKQRGLAFLLGEQLDDELGYRYQRNVARNSLLEHSLEKIVARFSRNGIEVLVLKGASVFTPDLSVFRNAFVLSDIDLMVRPSDMTRAGRILNTDGYSLAHNQAMNGGLKQGFVGADGVTRIDLHSALFWTSAGDYLDYGPSDLWQGSVCGSLAGHPLTMLSAENQICHRLVHDSIGHGDSILASSACRLYYLCVLVDFYRERIDWPELLQNLTRKGSDRLFVAYTYLGARELGLTLPSELKPLHRRADADLAIIDAVAGCADRFADYSHRTSLAVLTGRTSQERLKNVCRLCVRGLVTPPIGQTHLKQGAGIALHQFTIFLKMLCLQVMAILYIGAHSLRHSMREEKAHVG